MRRESLLIGLGVLIVVLLIGAAAVILSLAEGDVPAVSNPGNGVEGTLQVPPPRYDWTEG